MQNIFITYCSYLNWFVLVFLSETSYLYQKKILHSYAIQTLISIDHYTVLLTVSSSVTVGASSSGAIGATGATGLDGPRGLYEFMSYFITVNC